MTGSNSSSRMMSALDTPDYNSSSNSDSSKPAEPAGSSSLLVDTSIAILPTPPILESCTVRIFIYFLCEFKDTPTIVCDSVVLEGNFQYQDHCLWAELKVPVGLEIRFQLKVGGIKENGSTFSSRVIKPEHVREGMLYLDFSNELFDSYYGRNTTFKVDSIVPFRHSAFSLACRCDLEIFERELDFFFGKLRGHTFRYVTYIFDINKFFDHLDGQEGVAREDIFVKGIILSRICNKYDIKVVQNSGISLDVIKSSLPSLKRFPHYITLAEETGLHNACGREGKGLFFLTSALAMDFNGKEVNHYTRSFKHQAAAKFTEQEVQLLSTIDWKHYRTLSPQSFCGSIAAADQIGQRETVASFLLSQGLTEYSSILNKMNYHDYMLEWKCCLQLSPPITVEKIPFSLGCGKFREDEHNERQQNDIVALAQELLRAPNGPQRRTWAKHMKGDLQARARRQFPNSPQQYILVLLGIIQKMADDSVLVSEFHDMLPKVADASLKPRIKELLGCKIPKLVELERKALFSIIDSMSKEYLLAYHDILMNMFEQSKDRVLMEFYEHCWTRLVKLVIGDLTYSMQKQNCILKCIRESNNYKDSDLFYYLISNEVQQLFDTAYGLNAVTDRTNVLQEDAVLLADCINNKDVFPHVIPVLAEERIIDRLQVLVPDVQFADLQKEYADLKDQWTGFLESLVVMKNCEQFAEQATTEHTRYSEEFKNLESATMLSSWTAPDCHPQLRKVSERLTRLKESAFFQYKWGDPSLGLGLANSAGKSLTERWVEYFELYFTNWRELAERIVNGQAPVTTIEQIFAKNIRQLGPRFKGKILHSSEAEVRQQMDMLRKTTKEEIEKLVESELDIFILLTNARVEKAAVIQRVHQCVIVLAMSEDIIALQDHTKYINLDISTLPIEKICDLFTNPDKRTQAHYQQLVMWYDDFILALPSVKNLIQGFPSLFLNVIFEHNLLQIFSIFSDVPALNARIDTRQGEDIREETHDILHALRLLCDSQSILSHSVFAKIKAKATIKPQELLDFFVKCGSAVVALAILQDKLKKAGDQIVKEALQSDSEEKQTITIVKNLLVNGGKFVISVKDGTVATYATYKDPTRPQVDQIKIGAEELEALPSQLLLTSGVTTKNQANYNVDAPLPENIARLEDRECYVLRFNSLFDTAFQLSEVVKKLCHSGHPDYQDKTFSLDCHLPVSELVDYVRGREQLLLKWMNTFAAFRESHPILSFLSRSQLVSCLSGLRTQKIDLLYSTLQSIGCNPSLMSSTLHLDLEEALNINKADGLFKILANCLDKYFDVSKLDTPSAGVADLPVIQNPLSVITSPIRLVRVNADQNVEEVVCGAHISLHQRPPCPIEILFCTPRTTSIDVEDFLDRWALFTKATDSHSITFWLVKIEDLSYPTQSSCMQKLFKLLEFLPPTHPKLFFVIKGSHKTYISNILIRDETELKHDTCTTLSDHIRPVAASLSNIYIMHSRHCGEGKTTSIIRSLVCDKKKNGRPVLHAQFSLDTTPIDAILKRLLKARPMMSDMGVVLHFNIGHQANPRDVNLFLFQYLLVSSWRDSHGFTFPRHEKDTIVIELCNTGKEDERERISICKYFQELPLYTGISYIKLDPVPSMEAKVFYTFESNPEAFALGTRMLIANFRAMIRGDRLLPSKPEVNGVELVDEQELHTILSSIACNNWCDKRHLMMKHSNALATGDLECGRCSNICAPQEGFVHCATCNYGLCANCMLGVPVPEASELLFLRRLFWFSVTQLQNFYEAFVPWEFAFEEDGDIYRKLAYHYSRMIICCSQNLAKPAMEHYDEQRPLDDIRRCQDMDKFEDWRDTPFFLVTPNSYHVTSTSTFSPLQFIRDDEPNTNDFFHQWLALNESVLRPVDRSQLQQICSQLSEVVYSVDQTNPPLRTLLEVLGCWNGAIPILNAIDTIRGRAVGTKRISEMDSTVTNAAQLMQSFGKMDDSDITCTEFMAICTQYLNSLFGSNSSEKPSYTLTADNILRIMALQMRLISGIPVCIMGETGCGKTETLHFLSNISGNDFKVINVQEGMMEKDFYHLMKPHIQQAHSNPFRQIVVVLDEVNATSALWIAKDMLCDHICYGVRIPSNIVFVVILNPWKVRTPKQQAAIAEMDVGGLDFLKYQQNANKNAETKVHALNLVYQVHRSPETLYSLVWDWGSSSTTTTPLNEIKRTFEGNLLVQTRDIVSDELLMASSMVSWLIRKLENVRELRLDFKRAGDGTEGSAFWIKFRTIMVELLLISQEFLRHDVYLDEISVVSLRDIRKACELVDLFVNFWSIRAQLQKDQLAGHYPYFRFLTSAIHVALVNTYCLRLDSDRRLSYLVRVQKHWATVRTWFTDIHPEFMPSPSPNCPSYDKCDFYKSFNELATYVVTDLDIDSGIAVNQALKENTFAVLCAVCTKSTLFIVGRPGSTKSRALELLVRGTEERRNNTFLGNLKIVIQKHVVQCSPYTTAHHVHSNSKRAAMAQIAADKIVNAQVRRINVIVLEEVGATLGSVHNPLMSLHSMIDHGIEVDGKQLRLPIIGVSNYRLDASKMGRGRVVYRGNPPLNDLELTARAILRDLGETSGGEWVKNFSLAFSENILRNEKFTWYYGMRDFYATVRSISILATPLEQLVQMSQLSRVFQPDINSHMTRWAVLINLRGFPNKAEELGLDEAMHRSFGLSPHVLAKWEWKTENDVDAIRLCDCCCKMQLYRESLLWQSEHPGEELTDNVLASLFKSYSTPLMHQSFCQCFDDDQDSLPAAEVISYSLREITSRHVMVFTKANAALLLLFSMGLVRKDQCTVIFQSTNSLDQATTASELVQQMMRIKACMREGKTLILVKSRHLYESMLDALNVHYTKDRSSDESDNLHKTMLSMSGVTQSVFVRPTFRCIVLEDQDELESSVLPPMINRFSKTVLTYASALSPLQVHVRNRIIQQSSVEIGKNTVNLLQFLIPGLSAESLDSAIYAFSDFDEVVRRLCYCFSRKNLRRLSLKLVEGLNTTPVSLAVSNWNHSWKMNQCNSSFEKLATNALEGRQHLMVITEQLQLSASSVAQSLENIFSQLDETENVVMVPHQMTILNQATSTDVYTALAALKKLPKQEDTSAMSVFILDTTSATQSVQLDSFMYAVSSEELDENCHAVLIVVVSDFTTSSSQRNNFSVIFNTAWGQLFADEIVPRTLRARLPQCSLLEELEKDILLDQVLQSDLIIELALESNNLTTLCQSLSASASSVNHNMETISQLFSHDTPLRQQIIHAVRENTRLAEISFEKWSKIAFQKAKFSSDSLRAIYLNYLGEYVIRVLLHLLGILMQFDSLQLAEKAVMMDIISHVMKSTDIIPRCDIDACLMLAPLSLARSENVESKHGFFLFPKASRTAPGQRSKVAFPLSPFIIKHTFGLGLDVDAISSFQQSVGLDKLDPELRDKYFQDALCIGASVSPDRLVLLKKIVSIFHPDIFDSILSFHCFIAEHMDWFKSVMAFSMDTFSESSIASFDGKTVNDLANLAAIDGVVPFHRVDILCTITRNDKNIDWRLVRAMAMIDSACPPDQDQVQTRKMLVQVQERFLQSEVEGITYLLQAAPYHFIKYFFFELFSGEKGGKEDVVAQTISSLATRADLKHLIDNHEDLKCGIAFLLRQAFSIIFQQQEPEKSAIFNSVTEFIQTGAAHYALSSHCVFDAIFTNSILVNLDKEFVKKFESEAPLCYFIRIGLAVSILTLTLEMSDADAITYHELLDQLLQGNQEDIRQMTLFVLRRLSSNGTVDHEKAIIEARGIKYPPAIANCPVIDQVSQSLQKVSPLGCFLDFAPAVAALNEYAVSKTNNNLATYTALSLEGRTACIGSYCASVAPQPIANFRTEVFPVVLHQLTPQIANIMLRLMDNKDLQAKDEKIRELVLSLMLAVINDNKAVVIYKQTVEALLAEKAQLRVHRLAIEEYMTPKCPRCRQAFVDWSGCFAVYCRCGCSFCGHCLLDCGTDAHAHVQATHGSYHGSIDQFRREFGVIAAGHIRNYIQSLNARFKPLVEAELANILSGNEFYVRAEQIINQAGPGNGRARDVPPIVGVFLKVLMSAGAIWDRITKDNSEAESLNKLLLELEEHITSVTQLLFPDAGSAASAYSWLHAILWKLSKVGRIADRNAVQDALIHICNNFPNPSTLLGEFDKACRSHMSDILAELQEVSAQVLHKPFGPTLKRTILSLNRTIFDYKHQFWAHLKANYDTYPILNFLGEREISITPESAGYTLRIIKFLHQLQQAARKHRVTRAFASGDGSFYQFIRECGEPLASSVKVFEKDFATVFRLVTHWQCKDNIHNHYEHMLNGIPKDVKLECFLPQQRGIGILAMTLWGGRNGDSEGAWAGLPLVQNSLHHIIHGMQAPKVAGSPYFLTEKDIIAVNTNDITMLINELFVVPGFQPCLSKDFPVAEELCKYGAPRLAQLPYVAPELPEYEYGLEGILDLFAKVQARLAREPNPNGEGTRCFTTLPSSLASAVKSLIQQVPHAAELIFSFCGAILVQQSGEDAALGKEVAQIEIGMPLTDEQQQGRQTLFELPTALKSFHVDHIPALMGLCWNNKNVHASASIPFESEDEANQIVDTLKKIVDQPRYHCQIPALLASLRTAGFSLFSTEITDAYAQTPLLYYLTTISVPLIDDDDDITEDSLFQCFAKHFGNVLIEAERILGPHELSTPVLEDACIIPFAAVRQFLQSHIVETKKKPVNNTNNNNNNNNNNINNNNNNNNNKNNNNNNNNAPQSVRSQVQGRISVSSSSNIGDLEL